MRHSFTFRAVALMCAAGPLLAHRAHAARGKSGAGVSLEQAISDDVGLGFAQNGLSDLHRDYLAHGGLGAFIGDGVPPAGSRFRYALESIVEAYYSAAVAPGCAVSIDYQYVANPAYNAARGPVSITVRACTSSIRRKIGPPARKMGLPLYAENGIYGP